MSTPQKIVNNFTIKIATINGTGSQSANNILFKTLVRMGIPTSAKNLFPSNIQGLPTWFYIRTNPKGYQSMKRHSEVLIAVNPASMGQDLAEVHPGDVVIYDETTLNIGTPKENVTYYPVPLTKIAKNTFDTPRLRSLLTNTLYVGVMAEIFGLDKNILRSVIEDSFKKKQKAIDVNLKAIDLGIQYAKEHLPKKDPYSYEKIKNAKPQIVIEGNAATALGCIMGGCTVDAWYPITPASSLNEAMDSYGQRLRTDPETKKKKIAVIQVEDELCAIGAAIGAGWMGARAMTASSGPGISLMSEFLGLAYYAEVPVVIVNVQRVGPSTGMPTRTQQADILKCAFASHGDNRHILLFPATVKEAFELGAKSFDIADRLQTPVIVMTDLELGMNYWASEPFNYLKGPFDRGKVLTLKDLENIKSFGRYADIDKDGIPYRTLPGTPHPLAAYFTRGTGHTEIAGYSEDPTVYRTNMLRLEKKFHTAPQYLPKPIVLGDAKAKIGIISAGTNDHAIQEALDDLKIKKTSLKYLRVLAYPFHKEVKDFIKTCDKVIVIDHNRDSQLATLIKLQFCDIAPKIFPIAYSDGLPLDPDFISHKIEEAIAHG
ncbi:MAG: hypothetical protein A2Z91_09050 [Deltaproteobacteria bacterium GWA2_38_16]|nr:MAG: hypothetical protein A2Z91_09050 [Deltaproteobacteria bacterium GWA2_38_16]OGQ02555.1 MAG: hypothetical protein A3D19_09680 [Deltaproteobacteria bacterium RIFCSPHIGHO2_02_FULL_38_15]OGQ30591.1 MAG: hypothetical protein A3A72_08150 [Deltaproteobacteria bacterium RIFCSPLOWO2_01_FULL_38_9]OGQ60383.1 MAG: hypothetical protein A3G92_03330 [Deltaproteobacteria bacterium RIFCSPLOWO2_12_FULL_38_8]HBQ20990.1 2-oxoacid:acceptor oxidoreductase subunit alpha [Deltaproteobacteria bacterium]